MAMMMAMVMAMIIISLHSNELSHHCTDLLNDDNAGGYGVGNINLPSTELLHHTIDWLYDGNADGNGGGNSWQLFSSHTTVLTSSMITMLMAKVATMATFPQLSSYTTLTLTRCMTAMMVKIFVNWQ